MDIQQLETICKERRSIRKWQEKEVPLEMVMKAIELGCTAPSGGNRQPYHFYVITNKQVISDITAAVSKKSELLARWAGNGGQKEAAARWLQSSAFFGSAPVLVAVTAGIYQSLADMLLKQRLTEAEAQIMKKARDTAASRVQSAAAAIAQMLLAIHLQGLGAVWMTGPVQAKGEIEKILDIPEDEDFIALIPVGYPEERPEATPRKPLKEIVTIFD